MLAVLTLQSPACTIADGNAEPLGGIDHTMAGDIESSSIFGVRIADSFGTVVLAAVTPSSSAWPWR